FDYTCLAHTRRSPDLPSLWVAGSVPETCAESKAVRLHRGSGRLSCIRDGSAVDGMRRSGCGAGLPEPRAEEPPEGHGGRHPHAAAEGIARCGPEAQDLPRRIKAGDRPPVAVHHLQLAVHAEAREADDAPAHMLHRIE